MRALLLVLVVLSACAGPSSAPPIDDPGPDSSGLDADQMDALAGMGIPVLVPGAVGAFELVRFEAESDGAYGRYALGYERADGACFEVSGTNEGLGGPDWPLVSTEVQVADLGRAVRVYEASDDPGATSAQVWGIGTVVSDIVDVDGTGVLFLSDTVGGCRPVSLTEAAALVADLRLLSAVPTSFTPSAPTPSAGLGPFAPADDLLADYNAASTPRAAAEALARRLDADRVEVEILSETSYEATALVTATGVRDDSVRDERLRLTYSPYGPTWELVAAGRQTRCQPGRGHQDWSDALCQ
ncbi:hypothetical protein [Rubrivirga sp.]|uniref:hypothetical protein n=1 Tax=Rubrivirga sp. TaxID=1885344 RepID=UPI003B517139